ncbi:MAG: histidinol dehydrogenase [Gracilibacter sp. BRH_c7a]|nr:MAG: histidinol dehydrogenase [Gracilibacter sp. BRH_c7a]
MKAVQKYSELDIKMLTTKSYGDDDKLASKVADIINQVKEEGNRALYDLTLKYDHVDLNKKGLKVTDDEIQVAYTKVDDFYLKAIRQAISNVKDYHQKQKRSSWFDTAEDGSILGQLIVALKRVGIYVPGGTAAYPSSVLMNALPAVVAGVEEIVMVSPPLKDGNLLPEVLVAAAECGVSEIYKIGGAQAVAALAYGTETIAKVDKITGPGNIFVTLAKKQVYGTVDIDMLAGPSEILILTDESGEPKELAADLLSQAEHDTLASAILVSPNLDLLERTIEEVESQLLALPRADIARASWEKYGAAILVKDVQEGMDLANLIAPEHFELVVKDPFSWLGKVKNAGAVFLGRNTPEPVGDYFAGPNHVLPTGGTARFYSVLDVDAFIKKISVINYSEQALQRDADEIMYLARSEGLEAHARAIEVRKR